MESKDMFALKLELLRLAEIVLRFQGEEASNFSVDEVIVGARKLQAYLEE